MDEYTSKILAQTSIFIGLLPVLIAIFNRKNLNSNQRLLRNLVFLAIFTELLALLMGRVLIVNNLFISHIFTVVEFVIISLIYRKELSDIVAPSTINKVICLFVVYAIINSIWIDTIWRFNGFSRAVSSLIFLCYVLTYFYSLLKEVKIKKLETEPMFWMSTGLLIYFSASLFIFIFGNYIQPSVKLSFTFWGIHAIINITLYIFYAIALWIKPPKIV